MLADMESSDSDIIRRIGATFCTRKAMCVFMEEHMHAYNHAWLKMLGEVLDEMLPKVFDCLSTSAFNCPAFERIC